MRDMNMCGVFGAFSGFLWLENRAVGELGGEEPRTGLEDQLGLDCQGPKSSSVSPTLRGSSGSQPVVPALAVSASAGSSLEI